MAKIRIGIVGCGGMARSHASRFGEVLDRIQVTAVVDIQKERAQVVADLLGNDLVVETDYRRVMGHVDAVLIVLPHPLHHRATIDCLKAGKHVLVEKPMANSEQECIEMIDTAEKQNRVLMVSYCMRFHPLVVKMKELIDDKIYGDIFQLSIWTERLTRREEATGLEVLLSLEAGSFSATVATT